jgi:hypothetical protein
VEQSTASIHSSPIAEGRVSAINTSSLGKWVPGEGREGVGQRLRNHMEEWSKIGGARLVRNGISPMWIREVEAKEKLRLRRTCMFFGTIQPF